MTIENLPATYVKPPRVTDLRRVQAFVVVAEELHFRRAAARLAISQSPLSRVIRKLEKELNAPLFERSRRTVRLTAAGAALLPHARRLLDEVDAFADLARRALSDVGDRDTSA